MITNFATNLQQICGKTIFFLKKMIEPTLSLQMIAAQPHKKANWSRKTIAIQDSFLPLSL